MSVNFQWTGERVELLKTKLNQGFTFNQISAMLGNGCTRNAAIGKAHRLKLGPAPKGLRQIAAKARVSVIHTAQPPVARPKRHTPALPVIVKAPPPRPVTIELGNGERRGLQVLDLENHHCRWPLGEPGSPDFQFCGHDKGTAHASYCDAHAEINRAARKEGPGGGTSWTPQQKRDHRKQFLASLR